MISWGSFCSCPLVALTAANRTSRASTATLCILVLPVYIVPPADAVTTSCLPLPARASCGSSIILHDSKGVPSVANDSDHCQLLFLVAPYYVVGGAHPTDVVCQARFSLPHKWSIESSSQ